MIIDNPQPEACEIIDIEITNITKGPSCDIMFYDSSTYHYYINRGLELGLNLDSLKTKVLNKTVTLHLAKIIDGIISEHISQMALGEHIIYREYKN